MSVYVKQNSIDIGFSSSDNWTILSPIEQSIKAKIEAVGTPLKEWNIRINFGIKTGCNEAFIITAEKRYEILSNRQTEEEYKRTAKLIRPVCEYLIPFSVLCKYSGIKKPSEILYILNYINLTT